MTTIRQIISDSYEESRLIPLGGTPEAEEENKALRRLQSVLKSLFGKELGENLVDVEFGANNISSAHTDYSDITAEIVSSYIPSNSRLLCNLEQAYTVYLPPRPDDGSRFAVIDISGNFSTKNLTLNGNGRNIESSNSLTLNTNSLNREWFYRADLGNWVRYTPIDVNSDSPFPEEFDDLLVTMLSMRLNPTFGKEMSPESIQAYSRSKSQFQARYRQKKFTPSELSLWTPRNSFYSVPNWGFDKGVI